MSTSLLNFPLSFKRETSSYFSTTNTLSGLKLFYTAANKQKGGRRQQFVSYGQ